ncbi:hypothetical protein Rhopal_006491-T1 [Rhodotorula paludigena]|uniref:Ubiquitin-like domain-containing protein n=1 Tax=Rhodotorula paludigena TaxID=86838 RepID=A0AAV5GVB0_9BASI|nr:hypothetical protein Rhopal_006491-T1 [Rhodotorula paludigena]
MAQAGPSSGSSDALHVTLRLASHPVLPSPHHSTLTVDRTATVAQLKQRLASEWDGRPREDGVMVIKGGRVCRDAELLADVFDEELKATPPHDLVLHIIVRPSAWSAPFASTPPSASSNEVPTTSTGLSVPVAPSSLPLPLPSASGLSEYDPAALDTPTVEDAPPVVPPVPPAEEQPAPPPPQPPAAAQPSESGPPLGRYAFSPTAPCARLSAPPSSASAPAPPAQPSPGAAGPYATYLSHLQRLVPLQRALLLLNLQKALAHCAALVAQREGAVARSLGGSQEEAEKEELEDLEEVEELMRGVGVWERVEERVVEVAKRYEEGAEAPGQKKADEFQVVEIAGLPYLLHTPAALLEHSHKRPPLASVEKLERARCVQQQLTTMLQLLVTLQPNTPAVAHGRNLQHPAVQRALRTGGGAGAAANLAAAAGLGGAGAAPHLPGGALPNGVPGAPGRRRATLSVIINLDAIASILLPLIGIVLKLTFLCWIFARHASPTKRYILTALAVAWALFEAYALTRRRAQVRRDRARVEREGRRAVRNLARNRQPPAAPAQPAAPGQPGVAGPLAPPADDNAAAQPAAGADAAPRARDRSSSRASRRARTPPSRLSPKYWLNTIAAVGLVAEARELGLSPRFIAGRPIPPAGPPPRTAAERRREALRRALRNVAVAAVLFFGTLSPEVERKRRRALEKRERLLAERRVAQQQNLVVQAQAMLRAQQAEELADARAGARVETQEHERIGVEEDTEQDEQEQDAPAVVPDAEGLRRRRAAAFARQAGSGAGPAGRQRMSDEELFRDGPSEAYASTSAAVSSSAAPTASTSAAPTVPPPPPAAAVAQDAEPDEDELDVASASGDGGSTSGEDGIGPARARGGEGGAGREGEGEVDQVVDLF